MAIGSNTGQKKVNKKVGARKKTSIGLKDRPKHKNARRSFKKYRGQGRP